jgi:outer membrane biosynthesis protein TonB
MASAGFFRGLSGPDAVRVLPVAAMRATRHKATINAADRQVIANALPAFHSRKTAQMMPPSRLRSLVAGGGPRMTLAIALSFLLHALLLLIVPGPAPHIDYLLVRAAPPALSVHIAPLRVPADPGSLPPVRIEPLKPPVPVQKARNETPADLVGKEPDIPAPPEPVQVAPEPASYAGVNVESVLYLGPLPARAGEFEDSAEYLRESQVDEPPVAVDIAVPEYPRAAAQDKVGGIVLVAIFIDEDGHVVRAAPVHSSEYLFEFSDGIAKAMTHSTFKPARKEGEAVKSLIFQAVHLDPAMPAPAP